MANRRSQVPSPKATIWRLSRWNHSACAPPRQTQHSASLTHPRHQGRSTVNDRPLMRLDGLSGHRREYSMKRVRDAAAAACELLNTGETTERNIGRGVSTFVQRQQPTCTEALRQLNRHPCEGAVGLAVAEHTAQGVDDVGVEARRYNNQVRAKSLHRRRHNTLPRFEVRTVSRSGWQGNI